MCFTYRRPSPVDDRRNEKQHRGRRWCHGPFTIYESFIKILTHYYLEEPSMKPLGKTTCRCEPTYEGVSTRSDRYLGTPDPQSLHRFLISCDLVFFLPPTFVPRVFLHTFQWFVNSVFKEDVRIQTLGSYGLLRVQTTLLPLGPRPPLMDPIRDTGVTRSTRPGLHHDHPTDSIPRPPRPPKIGLTGSLLGSCDVRRG